MKKKTEDKLKAIELRKKGYSLNEIVKKLKVSKSSASVWVRNAPLSITARNRLLKRVKLCQVLAAEARRKETRVKIEKHLQNASREIETKQFSKLDKKTMCALIYWCEGSKDEYSGMYFANSDPNLVKSFLSLFRSGFDLDENKFRVCIHLHEYHDPVAQLNFWSRVTSIPKKQFIKSYLKPNTGKRIRDGYPGCIGIKYHSTDMARQLLATALAFFNKGV